MRTTAILTFGLLALLPLPTWAEERVVIEFQARGAGIDPRHTNESQPTMSGGTVIPVGTTGWAYLAAGSAGRDSLCSDASGSLGPGEDPQAKQGLLNERATRVWWFEVRPESAEVGKITLDLAWTHVVNGPGRESRTLAGDRRRIVLPEGESQVLDFVALGPEALDGPSARETCYRSLAVEVSARIEEDPAFAAATLEYELWWRHTAPGGRETRRRFQAVGRQGEEVAFSFVPIRTPAGEGGPVEGLLEVQGALRGRLRPDGTVAVDLGATRWTDAVRAGQARQGGIGDGGRKVFTVRPGETVSLPLPERMGGRNGITVEGRQYWVDNAAIYAGHRDELLLTVRTEPGHGN